MLLAPNHNLQLRQCKCIARYGHPARIHCQCQFFNLEIHKLRGPSLRAIVTSRIHYRYETMQSQDNAMDEIRTHAQPRKAEKHQGGTGKQKK